MLRCFLLVAPLLLACATHAQSRSSVQLEHHDSPLDTSGPDAVALPVDDRYRFGVVVGSVMTSAGERGCHGEVWLQPAGAPVRDVRSIAAGRLQNMFRFPQLLPGRYELGVRCFGHQPVRHTVEVRIGHVLRALVTMEPARVRKT
ncbi:MAG: carboxypeptidase regulatory-like domain-containing protein [Gemmatimonadales bacterium]|nr:carboxypeptidase regulatory-like domain-containing protein [Gemmatimonadales bacterium]MDQ3426205.1 carboxypeptidase-like regulatory domain-containing protein [Gemmatimonadota bacterium]